MKLTAYDKPIGSVPTPTLFAEPVTSLKRSDRHQMSWAQLCRDQGRHYHTWHHRVNVIGMHPLDALLKETGHA